MVHCGDSSVPLTTIKSSLDHVIQPKMRISKALQVSDEGIHDTMTLLHSGWGQSGRRNLLDLLLYGRPSEASDPHDKIYAFLGMANDGFIDMLDPDYEKPLFEVLENITKFLINRDGLLDIIYAAEAQERGPSTWQSKLPSWVPDWTVQSEVESFLIRRTPLNFATLTQIFTQRPGTRPLCESQTVQPDVSFDEWNSCF